MKKGNKISNAPEQEIKPDINERSRLALLSILEDEKAAQQELLKEKAYLRHLFDMAPEGIIVHDLNGKLLQVNREFLEMFGYSEAEVLGSNIDDLIAPSGRYEEARKLTDILTKGEKFNLETVRRRKNGTSLDVSIIGSPIVVEGKQMAVYAIYRDITERKRAEAIRQALYKIADAALGCRDLQQLFIQIHKTIAQLMPAENFYIALYDKPTGIISFPYYRDEKNDYTAPRKFGNGLTEYIISTRKPLLVNHEVHKKLKREGKAEFVGRPSKHWLGVPLLHGDKAFGTLVVQSYDENTQYTQKNLELLNFVADHVAAAIISTKTRQELTESEERYKTFIDSVEDMVFLKDEKLRYLLLNQATSKVLGRDIKDLIGLADEEVMPAEFSSQSQFSDLKALEVNDIIVLQENFNGRNYEVRKFPVRLANGKVGVGGYIRDVTDMVKAEHSKKMMQMELEQAHKMEAIGHLAGGVAHDFNNMLTGILGNAEILQIKLSGNEDAEGPIDNIIKSAGHAANLTKQLLAFARKGQYQLVPVNVHKVIGETTGILYNTIDKRIAIEQNLRANPATVLADPTQLENCLMNLGINARDAMSNGGRLVFSTELVQLDQEYIDLHQYKIEPGYYIQISVADTGTGMSEEVKKHLFEPFYTTKGPGKGTGLGLAGVYGCVKNHGGSVEVYSELGHGTVVKIYLPLYGQSTETELAAAVPVIHQGSGTVMIVDDEDVIRSIAAQLLENAGYRVVACKDGSEAVSVYRNRRDDIDLVILDMIMPNKNGRETYFELKTVNPGIKVLLSSGFSEDGEAQEIIKSGALGFIQKPYRSAELIVKVQQALSRE
jgi:PAS domain S-box-containing protein